MSGFIFWGIIEAASFAGTANHGGGIPADLPPGNTTAREWICLSEDGSRFVRADSRTDFVVWGVNYDHDESGRLIEDYWHAEWPTVEEDFKEIKALGVNVVRIHLQTAKFIDAPDKPNESALLQLGRLLRLAEETGLYLDITGLACYHKKDVPAWYDALGESERWRVQALFWEAVAKTCAQSPAVFCYDLMNEPILPGEHEKESEWLTGEFGGKYFVQRITLDLAGRTQESVAKAWIDTLVQAIRKHDQRRLITVGVIPFAFEFYPNVGKPLFYAPGVGENLDFTSVHFYPKKGDVDTALAALAIYDVGKPLVIEEMFPLKCSIAEMGAFIKGSRKIAEGWISFYWGKTAEEYAAENAPHAALLKAWLEFWRHNP